MLTKRYTLYKLSMTIPEWFICILMFLYTISVSFRGADFDLFMLSGARFRNSENIYYPGYQEGGLTYYYYGYPFSMILSLFSYFPLPLIKFIWACINWYFFISSWIIVMAYFDVSSLSGAKRMLFYTIVIAFVIHFLNLNLTSGQMTFLMLFINLKVVDLANKGKFWQAAALLGFGITVKVMPIAILCYLLYRGFWKIGLLTAVLIILYYNIPCWLTSYAYCAHQFSDWIKLSESFNVNVLYREYYEPMHSIMAVIMAYFTAGGQGFGIRRHIVDLPLENALQLMVFLQISFVLFTLYFIRRMPFKPVQSRIHELWELSYIFLATIMIFPMQQKYSLLFIFPAVIYVAFYAIKAILEKGKVFLILFSISFLLLISTIDMFFGEYFRDLSQYLKLSSFGVMLLMVCLAITRPREMGKY
jgi:hypothetical protein